MNIMEKHITAATEPPVVAMTLGWLGVVPFVALSCFVAVASVDIAAAARHALVSYGAIILGFMGGVQWGLEMMLPDPTSGNQKGYAASVVPAFMAFAATLSPPLAALWILIAGFGGLLAYELNRFRHGIGARWYATLRWHLSLAVITALVVAALASLNKPL